MLNEENTQCGEIDGQVALVIRTSQWWETFAVRRISFSTLSDRSVFFRFRLGDVNQAGRFGLARQGEGFIGLIFHIGEIYPDYKMGNIVDTPIDVRAINQQANVWYQVSITVDSVGRITWEVQPETRLNRGNQQISYTLNATMTNAYFRDQAYQFFLHSGSRSGSSTLYLRDYREGGRKIPLCPGE